MPAAGDRLRSTNVLLIPDEGVVLVRESMLCAEHHGIRIRWIDQWTAEPLVGLTDRIPVRLALVAEFGERGNEVDVRGRAVHVTSFTHAGIRWRF